MNDIKNEENIEEVEFVTDMVQNLKYKGDRALIKALQEIQGKFGYLPEKALNTLAEEIRVPMAKIYGVCTFYSQFRLEPQGKYIIQVCDGTACHVRGSQSLIDELESLLGIKVGETTEDMLFTLESVACIGACSLAPAIIINEETYAKVSPPKLADIVKKYRDLG